MNQQNCFYVEMQRRDVGHVAVFLLIDFLRFLLFIPSKKPSKDKCIF